MLPQYDRPGNVRELENAIERAVLPETTEVLQAHNLPPRLSPIAAARRYATRPAAILPQAEVERQALIHSLEVPAGNVTETARSLGHNRATLHRKLKKYGLHPVLEFLSCVLPFLSQDATRVAKCDTP